MLTSFRGKVSPVEVNIIIMTSLLLLCVSFSFTLVVLKVVFSDVYMLDEEMKWKVMPSLPKPDSHIEFAWKVVNNSIVIVGGTTEKHPETKKMVLVGEILQFNLNTMVKKETHVLACFRITLLASY